MKPKIEINGGSGQVNSIIGGKKNTINAIQQGSVDGEMSLAQATQEIQSVLDQLSETHPTETMIQKAQLAEVASTRVQANLTLKQRILSAIDAGTLGAISQALNHPAAAFFIEAVKDWNQNNPSAKA